MAIRKEFLGRGFAFPFHFDPAGGGVALSEYEENIRQNISIILGTQPGERQMLPDFGCRIHELLFAPDNSYAGQLAARHVEDALQRWEPRIEVIGVEVADPLGPYGAKGVGEIGLVPTAPAVANALWAHDGVRRFELPIFQIRRKSRRKAKA